ncbi:MAG: phosphoesterase [Planctomycetota bacterium]|nr:MAG: phosphoesterase [Planctomycetota bacterium]
MRYKAADIAYNRPLPSHPDNGEEAAYPYVANFSKGMPHNSLGEVDPVAYAALIHALTTGSEAAFESIPLGGTRKLRNPQCGLATDLEGPDCSHLAMPPAPRIDSPENSGEIIELYWMALCRDVPFSRYDTDATVAAACADLNQCSDFRGPKMLGQVTPQTLFRFSTPGDVVGPYVSQFFMADVNIGAQVIPARMTVGLPATYMTTYADWLAIQNGFDPGALEPFDSVKRMPRNGRDLATYVHLDLLYQAYFVATLRLMGMGAAVDAGNPYTRYTRTDAFGTFSPMHLMSLVTEVATRALKAVWFQKWYVHRRLRPEEFGGRIHNHLTGVASYPIDAEVLNSQAVADVFSQYGTYLLPQPWPEACPLHPAYGSGHATVAGACVTILKAWFDDEAQWPNPMEVVANGTDVRPYRGLDAGQMTIGGELNKVAANVASGRNMGGIHWRTDGVEGLKLGEAVAIGILEEQKLTYQEPHSFSLTKFDGTRITI